VAQAREVISFGPFSLIESERLLTRDGDALQLGARAFDILVALVSRPNQAVSKAELIAAVWPDVTVGEGSLRFHIAELRGALGDGRDGARYIATLAGRGYCFVAPVSRATRRGDEPAPTGASLPRSNLPARLPRMVGRADGVLMLSTQLTATRFVTIVGAGGVGKTTIAVAVGHELMAAFAGAVFFLDLGALSDSRLVGGALAAVLELSVHSVDPTPGLIDYLRDKRLLLVFDNCEHVVEAAATLATRIFAAAPNVHVLATSRELLRVEGEHGYRLAPLPFPPDEPGLTAAVSLTFPAIQLFVERATATGARLDLSDSNAAIVAGICRRLDGIALAIEVAAGRVEAYGLQQTAALLEERLSLLWRGQRTAPPRQKTLKATLDWSYGLLSELEQLVLRQLGIFVGHFSLAAARAVLKSAAPDEADALAAIDSLIAKSLISAAAGRWRLLESIRSYALEKLAENGETAPAAHAHLIFFRDLVVSSAPGSRSDAALSSVTLCSREIDNVRAALDWAFTNEDDIEIGIALTAAYVPVWLHFGWYSECRERTQRAIEALRPELDTPVRLRMQLQCGLGMAMLYPMAPAERVEAILSNGLALAEELDERDVQLRTLWALWLLYVDTGNFRAGRTMVERFANVARQSGDPAVELVAERLAGYTLQFGGDQPSAKRCAERLFDLYTAPMDERHRFWFLHDQRVAARDLLARALWLLGFVDQASDHARACLDEAKATGNFLSICEALRLAVGPIALATGDLVSAQNSIALLNEYATRHNATYFKIVARCLEGELLIKRAAFSSGAALLGDALGTCAKTGWAVCYPAFQGVLAEGLLGLGRTDEALYAVELALAAADRGGERWAYAELLRIKGECLLGQEGHSLGSAAEDCFSGALDVARQQGALFWELRAAMCSVRLKLKQGRPDAARQTLVPVYNRFVEGFQTADLKAAKHLMEILG
jgi:predicted ATPase/DNA-binding winged helix-turn-helix (wHTH) protein